ncbi:MAG: aminotransferase class I/II-fold pyridoxal phosphate-dependent enzyme [Desulfomonile tiedjei]|nr:aminotransferase class I/II-fold pyridoxal phosphate-dependent enzyme [Desulfomonile tiedjei]
MLDLPGRPMLGVGTLNVSPRAKELVMEALNNNRLSYGPMVQQFERDFARLHGCRFGVMSNSGTSALHIALQAMKELHGWQDGDEVIVPTVTFVATANVVLHNRMVPVLVDVEPVHYQLDPEKLEAKITPRTRCIIPVHLFGQPADMAPILAIARRHNLKIIEDSCETMFARYEGQPVGSFGDIACFSTYIAHLLVTGVGGLNTTKDPEYALRLRSLMNHGRDSIYISIDDDDSKSSDEMRTIIARRFKFVSVGHSFRVTELEGALGLAQLEEYPSVLAARQSNAGSLTRKLRFLDPYLQLPSVRPSSEHAFMMYPIVLRGEKKDELVNFLEANSVETRDMLPLTNQPVYHRLLGWQEDDYPVAKWINHNGFYIGCHQDLMEADLDYMAELFEGYFRRRPLQSRDGAELILTLGQDCSTLEHTLDEVPSDLFEKILAVDTGGTPEALAYLKERGIETYPANGKEAFHLVLDGAIPIECENLVFFRADGRHNPRDIGRLLLALERGSDMVTASRFLPGGARHDRAQGIHFRSIGNRVFTLLANVAFYGNLSDAVSSFRAIKRKRLSEVKVAGRGHAAQYQLSIQALKLGWKVAELPTVEIVNPELNDRKEIVLSAFPVLMALIKEWASYGKGADGSTRNSLHR